MPHLMMDLPCASASAGAARSLVRDLCSHSALGTGCCEDAALVVTELVANAARHAHGIARVSVATTAVQVRLQVSDASTRVPRRRAACELDEDGRGFAIVDALCSSWGHYTGAGGKTVWAELHSAA